MILYYNVWLRFARTLISFGHDGTSVVPSNLHGIWTAVKRHTTSDEIIKQLAKLQFPTTSYNFWDQKYPKIVKGKRFYAVVLTWDINKQIVLMDLQVICATIGC